MNVKRWWALVLCLVLCFSFGFRSFATAAEWYSTPSGKEIYRQIRMQDAIDTIMEIAPIVLIFILAVILIYFLIKAYEKNNKINLDRQVLKENVLKEKFLALSEKDKDKIFRYLHKK